MPMGFRYRRQFRYIWGMAVAMATIAAIVLATPTVVSGTPDALGELPVRERVALQDGDAIVSRNDAGFIARVLVRAPVSTAWEVLTDYNNFEQFFPNVEESQLLEANGNRRVFEQTNLVRVLLGNSRSRVKIAVTETYPERIEFALVEGDLDALQGNWSLAPIAPHLGAPPDRVLISYQVAIEPLDSTPQGIFFKTYQRVLEKTMPAIKQEVDRRLASSS